MNIDEILFKKILNLTNVLKKKDDLNYIFLENYLSRFIFFACAISEEKINIISDESFGGYVKNNIILPTKISISDNKDINIFLYIYKILFLLLSRKYEFSIYNNVLLNSYKNSICSLLIVNSIHRILIKKFPMIYKLIYFLYPTLRAIRNNYDINDKFLFLLNLLINILMFDKKKIYIKKLYIKEQYFINYIVKILLNNNLELKLSSSYILNYLNKLYKINYINNSINNFCFNILWGQLYNEDVAFSFQNFSKRENFSLSSGKEYKNKLKNEVEVIKYKKNSNKDNPIVRMLEHVKTAEQYKNGIRDTDGVDDMEQHMEAINEIDIKQITRSPGQTKSIFSMEMFLNLSQKELNNDEMSRIDFVYNEWDYLKNQYKLNWCKIYNIYSSDLPVCISNIDVKINIKNYSEKDIINYYIKKNKKDINYLSFCLQYIFNSSIWVNRQIYGQEIDIDTITDRYAFLFSGNCNFENFYLNKKNLNKEICIVILVDSSLSTDSWFKGKKISVIVREIVIVLGESLSKIFNNFFSVNAFYSNTRNDCKYIVIKNFSDSWNSNKIFLCRISPIGYTRIGPALRHSMYCMSKFKIKHKLLLLISDTKPTDYDVYEGKYGIADVKKCVYEAYISNIKIKAISIDDKSKFYLPHMFGKNNYYLLKDKVYIGKLLSNIFFDCFMKK